MFSPRSDIQPTGLNPQKEGPFKPLEIPSVGLHANEALPSLLRYSCRVLSTIRTSKTVRGFMNLIEGEQTIRGKSARKTAKLPQYLVAKRLKDWI